MRKLGLWLIKAVHVMAVVALSWVGGGMWLGKNSSPSESTMGGWLSAGAVVVAVLGAVLIYGRQDFAKPLKSTLLGMAIVWMASAIMTPVFQSAKSAVKPTVCTSNVKQLGTAAQIYAMDSNDTLPPATSWQDALHAYTKAEYQCPEAKSKYSYGMNSALGGLSADKIESPERTVLFFEMDSDVPSAHGTAKDAVARHDGWFTMGLVDGSAKKNTAIEPKWTP